MEGGGVLVVKSIELMCSMGGGGMGGVIGSQVN